MSHILEIDDCVNRYHVDGGDTEGLACLEKAGRLLIDRELEAAVESLHLDTNALICIREIRLPVYLDTSSATSVLAGTWSDSIAREIQQMIGTGDKATVVRFRTRAEAWVECSKAVVVGDVSRMWAWEQIGLLPCDSGDSARIVVDQWLAGLAKDAPYILPVMSAIREEGLYPQLCLRLTARHWSVLAEALVECFTADLTGVVDRCASRWTQESSGQQTGQGGRRPARSAWPGTTTQRLCMDAKSVCTSTLILLATIDPGLLVRSNDEIESNLMGQVRLQGGSALPGTGTDPQPVAVADDPGQLSRETRDEMPIVRANGHRDLPAAGQLQPKAPPVAGTPHTDRPSTNDNGADGEAGTLRRARQLRAVTQPDAIVELASAADKPAIFAAEQKIGSSRSGGLLFYLNLMNGPDGAYRQLADDEVFAGRPATWIWYWLGRSLVPVAADDCALLTFAGLVPDYDSSRLDERKPDTAQQASLLKFADALRHLAEDKLELAGMPAPVSIPTERNVRIIADRGWFECEFSLQDVDTAVRGAGLDLNPGFLPWIGCVVRFRYA